MNGRELIFDLKCCRFRKSASFEGIAYAYNDEHLGIEWMNSLNNTQILDRRRLSEAWYKKTLIEMKKNYNLQTEIEYILSDKLEGILECEKDVLWEKFSIKWSSSLHTDNCNHEGTTFNDIIQTR